MIYINLTDRAYENDIYPLVKAFYPEEDLKVEELSEEKFRKLQDISNYTQPSEVDSQGDSYQGNPFRIVVVFSEQRVFMKISLEDKSELHREVRITEGSTKTQYKNTFKRLLYSTLEQISSKQLPWGILTGIRPTKIVYELLEAGMSEDKIIEYMRDEYLCSEDKLSLSLQIATRERELLKEIDYQKGYSLYIGIPFCPSTCLYCSFPSYSIMKFSAYVEEYLKALEKEIQFGATALPGKRLTTVYLGGGTPTTLTVQQLEYLLNRVKEQFDFTYVKEFCVEAGRPDSITKEKLEVLKRCGVDRISINPQSMQQRTLDLIGRRHSVDQIKEAFHLAREAGHDNINMDIIIGLPGENPEDVTDTLEQIKELNPDSLTVHTLALKRAARLNIEKDQYQGLKATDVSEMLQRTMEFTQENAYLPYYLYRQKNMADNLENIGYARYGKEGLYNILIMEEQQTILALGAGAMSKFVFHKEHRIERVDNVKSVTDYISRIDEMIQRKSEFLDNNTNV